MTGFTEGDLAGLRAEEAAVPRKMETLQERLLERTYASDVAREHAHHGAARRNTSLAHCIGKVFELLPPGLEEIPPASVTTDATMFIQAFVFNTFGMLDNLAFIWVYESDVRRPNGRELGRRHIGLTPEKKAVRASLPEDLRLHLDTFEGWFNYLASFRHALGHRIPLYIPPFIVEPHNAVEYERLAREKEAAAQRRDFALYGELDLLQSRMRLFRPFMKHSFSDPHAPVVFHGQMLADYSTVQEIALRILDALPERRRAGSEQPRV